MFNTLSRSYVEPTQQEPKPGMVSNNAGGFSYEADDFTLLQRFLILGTTGGSYYVGEKELTKQGLDVVDRCIAADPARTLQLVTQISEAGRAPKNDQALYVLAKLCSVADESRKEAWKSIPKVARTFTHLSHFVNFVKKGKMRGWGRGFRKAVAGWYNAKSVDDLIYQAIKYKSRDGFSQKDVAVLSHVASFLSPAQRVERSAVLYYLGYKPKDTNPNDTVVAYEHPRIDAAVELQNSTDEQHAAGLVRFHNLPMEAVPTNLRGKELYRAVCDKPNMGWLIRNLGNLSKVELLHANEPQFVQKIIETITNEEQIKKSRLHPLAIYTALHQYKQGRGFKGNSTWTPVPKVLDALTDAFYASFKYVEPSGKRFLFAVDTSGSMTGSKCAGIDGLDVHEAAAVLATVAAKAEPHFTACRFDTGAKHLLISPKQRLDDVVNTIRESRGGGTNCALPFKYAIKNNLKIDCFVVFTDSETWQGDKHVMDALNEYRAWSGINAKAINIAMVMNQLTNFDKDPLCLEVTGFDTTIPEIISTFAADDVV